VIGKRALASIALLALAGCGSGGSHPAASATPARLQRLRGALPDGFQAPGRSELPPGPTELVVAPAAGMNPNELKLAPAPPEDELRKVLAVVLNQPTPVIARRIFLSSTSVRPAQRIAVAAAHLRTAPHHAALFILQGPGYRAEHLIQVSEGVAAGYITLPSHVVAGQWYIAAEDTSGLRVGSGGKLTGSALVDIGVLTTGAPTSTKVATQPKPTSATVALSLRSSTPVYVCLIGDGRKLIPGRVLLPGTPPADYRAHSFAITLGNSSVVMLVDGASVNVPSSNEPVGYSVVAGTGVRRLPASKLPTCR